MTGQPSSTERLSDILTLACVLAEHIQDALILKEPIQDVQIRSLLNAGSLLRTYDMPLPPLLTEILNLLSNGNFGRLDGVASVQNAEAVPGVSIKSNDVKARFIRVWRCESRLD